jgi:hypothetical protein
VLKHRGRERRILPLEPNLSISKIILADNRFFNLLSPASST